jgi:hypothetical protein
MATISSVQPRHNYCKDHLVFLNYPPHSRRRNAADSARQRNFVTGQPRNSITAPDRNAKDRGRSDPRRNCRTNANRRAVR